MSILSVSSSEEVFFDVEIDEDRSKIEGLAHKIQSIWEAIYDVTIGNLVRIVHVIRSAIGSLIRDICFFPLKWSLIANMQSVQELLQIEETYSCNFWDPSKPIDPNLKDHARIREKFSPPEDRVFPIQLKDGKTGEITCRIIETKEKGDKFYNFAQVPGIFTTISNNIATSHPYMAAYLNATRGEQSLPPARGFSLKILYTPPLTTIPSNLTA